MEKNTIFFFIQFYVPFKIYFSSYETGQSVGGRKRENLEKNHLAHPQAELGLSHMWPVRGLNPHQTQRCDDRVIKRNSALNHSATGAAEHNFYQNLFPNSHYQIFLPYKMVENLFLYSFLAIMTTQVISLQVRLQC